MLLQDLVTTVKRGIVPREDLVGERCRVFRN
jgi:hypothetical protein